MYGVAGLGEHGWLDLLKMGLANPLAGSYASLIVMVIQPWLREHLVEEDNWRIRQDVLNKL